MLELSVGRCCR